MNITAAVNRSASMKVRIGRVVCPIFGLLASLLACSIPVQAAAVAHCSVTTSTANASTYAATSCDPAASDLIVVLAVAAGTVDAGDFTDDNGGTYTLCLSATYNTTQWTIYTFIRNTLSDGTAFVGTLDVTGDAATGALIFITNVSGMTKDGDSGACKQSAKQDNQAASGIPAPAFASSALTGNPTLGIIGNLSNPIDITEPTGWTEPMAGETEHTAPDTGAEYVYRDSGFTGTTITWGSASATAFGSVIIELDASTSGGSGFPPSSLPLLGVGAQ